MELRLKVGARGRGGEKRTREEEEKAGKTKEEEGRGGKRREERAIKCLVRSTRTEDQRVRTQMDL